MAKTRISDFLTFFLPHAAETKGRAPDKPPAGQFGYIMGSKGEVLTERLLERFAGYQSGYSKESYLKKGRKWLGRQVFDCNGMSEYFTGYDTKARYNYRDQCAPKSPEKADRNLAGMPQLPGVAVFSGDSAGSISHVGYLLYKHGAGALDWYVVEARGVDYGVVITRLGDRNWRWWGLMSKYFSYDLDERWDPHASGDESGPVHAALERKYVVVAGVYNRKENAETRWGQINAKTGGLHWRDDVMVLEKDGRFIASVGQYNLVENARVRYAQAWAALGKGALRDALQILYWEEGQWMEIA